MSLLEKLYNIIVDINQSKSKAYSSVLIINREKMVWQDNGSW